MGKYDWLLTGRAQLLEGYGPPLFPTIDYDAEHIADILQETKSNIFRFPAIGYYAFYPTRYFPVHPDMQGRDLLKETIDACHKRGIKVIPYVSVGHPFLPLDADIEPYNSWAKLDEEGKRLAWWHLGYFKSYNLCLNRKAYREAIKGIVNEIVTGYDVDGIYFDGPYHEQGSVGIYCHCPECKEIYFKKTGKSIPSNKGQRDWDNPDNREYLHWLNYEVKGGLMKELNAIIKKKDIPHLFNNCGWFHSRYWGNDRFKVLDGFMFEGVHTVQEKLLHIMLGRSTGKYIWSYISGINLTQHQHLIDDDMFIGADCMGIPVDGEEIKNEGFTVIAGNGAPIYYAISRIYRQNDTVEHLKDIYGYIEKNEKILEKVRNKKFIGMWVSGDTADWWFKDSFEKCQKYKLFFYGGFNVLKDNFHQVEPFYNTTMSRADLSEYKAVFLPNVACMSEEDMDRVRDYVREGGNVVATFMTSLYDEKGNRRDNFGLTDLFGADLAEKKDIRFRGQCYVKILKSHPVTEGFKPGQFIPQDMQFLTVKAHNGDEVVATTSGIDHDIDISPAVIVRKYGKGTVVFMPQSLEALYRTSRYVTLRKLYDNIFRWFGGKDIPYEVEGSRGIVANMTESEDCTLLHLINDNGNKIKSAPTREEYVPVYNIKVKINTEDRRVESVHLLYSDSKADYKVFEGYVEVYLPKLYMYECIKVQYC